MKADDFLGRYQTMEQSGVTSTEKVQVENLADRLRIEITAAGMVCATQSNDSSLSTLQAPLHKAFKRKSSENMTLRSKVTMIANRFENMSSGNPQPVAGISRRELLKTGGKVAAVVAASSVFSPFVLTGKAAAPKTLSFWQFYAPARTLKYSKQMV